MAQTDEMRAYQREYRRDRRQSDEEYRLRTNRHTNAALRKKRRDPKYADRERGENYARGIRHRFGITVEEYDKRLALPCEICGKHLGRGPGKMHLDHDHLTGDLRGTLCQRCNCAIGLFEDNPARLREAVEYLARYSRKEG